MRYKLPIVLGIFLLNCMFLYGQSGKNYTAIRNTNVQIRASFHDSPLAWAADKVSIKLNKQTGDLEAKILVDDLHYAVANEDFKVATGATGENKGKYLTLTGVIPVNDVLQNQNNAIDLKVEMTANFNNINYHTTFSFTILSLQQHGFSVMANGTISHSALQITNLRELDDDLAVILSFVGY